MNTEYQKGFQDGVEWATNNMRVELENAYAEIKPNWDDNRQVWSRARASGSLNDLKSSNDKE
jgi:hypothetical protein